MKLQKQQIRKIDISLINKTENIRKQYNDIESLARSIERDGQLQPIGVVEQEDGTYNLLYGFRRYHAYLFLINEGKDFNQIEAKITTGDPAIIQLIENIHRDNLKPVEFENALQALIDSGLTQKEISERLNIRITRVSDALAAKRTRDSLAKKNIDTSDMSTSTVSLLRSVPEEKQVEVVKKVKKKGGTVKAAKEMIDKIKLKPSMSEEQYIKQAKKRALRKPPNIKPKIDIIETELDEENESITIKADITINPDYCTKSELCENQTGCKICSYNIENQKQSEPEEKLFIQMSIKAFSHLPEVKAIIDCKKIILQSKCEYCGKEV